MKTKAAGNAVRNARARILVPVLLVLAALAVVFLTGVYALRQSQADVMMEETARTVAALERQQLESSARLLRALGSGVMDASGVENAFEGRNKAELRRLAEPFLEKYGPDFAVTRLCFLLPDRHPFLSVRHGEKEAEAAVLGPFGAVFKEGVEGRLTLSTGGELALEIVVPWQVDGQTIGYLELTRDLSGAAEAIHRATGYDLLMLVHKDVFDHDAWEQRARERGQDSGWDQLSESVAVVQTLKSIPTPLGLILEDDGQPKRAVLGGDGDRQVFHIAWMPLADANGNPLGNIVVLHDATKAAESFRRIMLVTVAACLMCGVILFFLLTGVIEDVHPEGKSVREPSEPSA